MTDAGGALRASQAPTLEVAPACAVAVAVLVGLNLVGHPLVVGATFSGLALLAMSSGHGRLVAIGLLVGVGLLLAVPGVAMADGSFSLTFGAGAWSPPGTPLEWAGAVAGALRIPAQVLAAVPLLLVPAERVLAAAAQLSPRTALLGGLAARLQPLLVRDLRAVRDELASRGVAAGRGSSIAERVHAARALWEAMLSDCSTVPSRRPPRSRRAGSACAARPPLHCAIPSSGPARAATWRAMRPSSCSPRRSCSGS